jgi:phosphoadenosine phosphosulfate reductase
VNISSQAAISLPHERYPSHLRDPRDVLYWATTVFGDRIAIASALGPQTLVILDLLHNMGRSIQVFFLDTGLLFKETYELRRKIEDRYGIRIQAVRPEYTVAGQAERYGDELWRRAPDLCCGIRKVRPLQSALRGLDAWVTGLRRDQSSSRKGIQVIEWDSAHGLVKVNPLAHWSRDQVQEYLKVNNVPYNTLLDQGYKSIGCRPCTSPVAVGETDERAGRWSGCGKTECGIHALYTTEKEVRT